jgi:uncharacterized membrane protein
MSEYCPKCGISLPTESKFCFKCGAAIPTASPTPDIETNNVSEDPMKLVRPLCYIAGILSGVLFLNMDPYRQNKEIRFHAWQSIFFTLTWLGVLLLHTILPFIFFPLFPMTFLIQIAFFALWVILLVKAYNGEIFKLPILGEMAQARSAKSADPDS